MFPTDQNEIATLPVNVLGVHLLQWMRNNRNHEFHRTNLTLAEGIRHELRLVGATRATQERIGEAWDWLKQIGAIAETPGNSNGWHYVTDRGNEIAESADPITRVQAERLLLDALHPRINERIKSQVLLGEYESAVLLAFREVEIWVRELGGFDDGLIGTKLMQEALKSGGPLTDQRLEAGEQVAIMNLFAGSIGAFKNPSSHRQVDYGDTTVASEAILLADLLLRILDQYDARRQGDA